MEEGCMHTHELGGVGGTVVFLSGGRCGLKEVTGFPLLDH